MTQIFFNSLVKDHPAMLPHRGSVAFRNLVDRANVQDVEIIVKAWP